MNTELKKNAEGYTDPTAAATLNNPEPVDIWTYMSNECLILKNHGYFSTCLLLGAEKRRETDVEIQTNGGARYTDPRKLTWGARSKMYSYLDNIGQNGLNQVVTAVEGALGITLPREENDGQTTLDEVRRLKTENAFLCEQLRDMDELHTKAVEQVNKISFAKLKAMNQLELLQSMVGSVLAHFQLNTGEEEHEKT